MTKVLITGGTGMIGTPLTNYLLDAGYDVVHLSRTPAKSDKVPTFQWNIEQGIIDPKSVEGIDAIVHLAGAGIVDKPWTGERKQEIIDSRVKSAELLLTTCKKEGVRLKAFISASAIGWYPLTISDEVYGEEQPAAEGFLGEVCQAWEGVADHFKDITDRVVKLRIGLVLARDQGALKKIALPVRLYTGAGIGSGEQAMSWIHIQDACRMFQHSIDNDLNGVYNAVGPDTITNEEFMQILADVMEKPILLPNIPEFVIRMIYGRKADIILKGVKLSSNKILATGFEFDYPTLNSALMHIYND
ncbi:MAG: TIGR01777 family oxidoreductase [Cryomorphaceae bacterium]